MVNVACRDHIFTDIKAIVFDKDGTLADVESYLNRLGQMRSRLVDAQVPGVQESLLLTFGLEDTILNSQGLLAVGSRHDNQIAAAAYVAATGRHWLEALNIVESAFKEADSYLQNKANHTPLFPGTREHLQQFHRAGLKLGIVSADSAEQIQAFVETNNLQTYIPNFVSAAGIRSKPHPSAFFDICTQLNIQPSQTLMVGDALVDMEMAKAAAAAGGILVAWGWSTRLPTFALVDRAIDQWQQLSVVN